LAISTAAVVAWAASSEPSVASNIFVGKWFIITSFLLLPSGYGQDRSHYERHGYGALEDHSFGCVAYGGIRHG
jgi:hypothetical protein